MHQWLDAKGAGKPKLSYSAGTAFEAWQALRHSAIFSIGRRPAARADKGRATPAVTANNEVEPHRNARRDEKDEDAVMPVPIRAGGLAPANPIALIIRRGFTVR